jgi:phage gp46-like protein
MQTLRRAARFLHPLLAGAIVGLVFLQVYLIAAYIFGDTGVLDTHVWVGRVVVLLELLVLVTALVGWWGDRYEIGSAAALLLIGALQAGLAKDIGSSAEVHALHALLALAVFGLAWSILVRTRGEVATVGG